MDKKAESQIENLETLLDFYVSVVLHIDKILLSDERPVVIDSITHQRLFFKDAISDLMIKIAFFKSELSSE